MESMIMLIGHISLRKNTLGSQISARIQVMDIVAVNFLN